MVLQEGKMYGLRWKIKKCRMKCNWRFFITDWLMPWHIIR